MGCSASVQKPARLSFREEEEDPLDPGPLAERHEAVLSAFFLGEYLDGQLAKNAVLRKGGYELVVADELGQAVYRHVGTGTSVWRQALNFTAPETPKEDRRVAFLYTTTVDFKSIARGGGESAMVQAALTSHIADGNGPAVYASQREPHNFGSLEAIMYNNFGLGVFKEPNKWFNRETNFVRCCVPIIVDTASLSPLKDQHGGPLDKLDRFGNMLPGTEPLEVPLKLEDQMFDVKADLQWLFHEGRDVVVLKIGGKSEIERAKEQIGDVMRRRLKNEEKRPGGKDDKYYADAGEEMAGYLLDCGDFEQALELYQHSLKVFLKAFGENHPSVARLRNAMGNVYLARESYDEAFEQYEMALNQSVTSHGEMHIAVALNRSCVAKLYQRVDETFDAMEQYELALSIREASLGAQHPSVAETLCCMAAICETLYRYDNALEHYQQALEIQMAALGEDHPEVADTRNSMGVVYWKLSRYSEALDHYEKALDIKTATLGNRHPSIAVTLNNLGLMYQEQSKYDEALEKHELALDIQSSTLGERHAEVAGTRVHIAAAFEKQARHDDAIDQYELALKIQTVALGEFHQNVADTRSNMGDTFQEQLQYDEALEQYESALHIYKATCGKQHPSVASTRDKMGSVYQKQAMDIVTGRSERYSNTELV